MPSSSNMIKTVNSEEVEESLLLNRRVCKSRRHNPSCNSHSQKSKLQIDHLWELLGKMKSQRSRAL
jgi:hypothetical protein